MEYVIFSVVLVATNFITFRLTVNHLTNVIEKDFSDVFEKINEECNELASTNHIDRKPHNSRPSSYESVKDFIMGDRHDAEQVLTKLKECADRYGVVSMAEFYDLIKVASNFTDNSYGWRRESIHTAEIVPVRWGYVIKFPPVEQL